MLASVSQVCELVGGTPHGELSSPIVAALPLHEAGPDSVTFLSDVKHRGKLLNCRAGLVLAPRGLGPQSVPTVEVDDPLAAMILLATRLRPPAERPAPGIDPRAAVDSTATVPADCHVGPFAVIEAGAILGRRCVLHPHAVVRTGCKLGDDVEIHPHAVIYPHCVLGNRTVVHAGAVIGKDGFGFRFQAGRHERVPQQGTVEIGADVEVGSLTAVDRATFGATRIGEGTKLDNLVHVAHNCRVGRHNIMAGHVGVAGSCTTGDLVVLAGKCGIADQSNIGDRVTVGAFAAVPGDIEAGSTVLGAPARPAAETRRVVMAQFRLPKLLEDFRALAAQVAELESRLGQAEGEAAAAGRKAG